MLRKFLVTTTALVFAAGLAAASQIPIVSGPQDPSQMLATINSLIQSINSGVNGRLTAQVTATGTTTTTTDLTMATYSLPASQLAVPGDAVRVVCWAKTVANSNSKNAKLFFGSTSISLDGNAQTYIAKVISNQDWYLELIVMRNGAATQQIMGRGAVGLTPIAASTQSGTETLTAAVTIKCTGTTPSAAQDITANGFLVEQIK